jgi:hypothetical protein
MNMTIPHSDATISLRDWFAGQLAAAYIVAPKQPGVAKPDMAVLAKMAYEQADALLKQRG